MSLSISKYLSISAILLALAACGGGGGGGGGSGSSESSVVSSSDSTTVPIAPPPPVRALAVPVDCEANPEDARCPPPPEPGEPPIPPVDCEANPGDVRCPAPPGVVEPLIAPVDCEADPEDPRCPSFPQDEETPTGPVDCDANPDDPRCPHPVAAASPIVYTRQPINRTPIVGNAPDSEVSNFQYASDVARINARLTETDVVLDNLDGSEPIVIFNCTSDNAFNCVAHEARVSPDGTKIAYSVGFSAPGAAGIQLEQNGEIEVINKILCAQIYIYDTNTNTSAPVPNHPDGGCAEDYDNNPKAIDRQPDWLSNDEIVFVSNRANKWPHRDQHVQHLEYCVNYPYCVSQTYGYDHSAKALQLHKMNIDGTGVENWNPEGLNSLSPAVLTNGDVLFSCYNAHADKASSPGQQGLIATPNLMWLCRVDGNGADLTVKVHGHKQDTLKAGSWLPTAPVVGGVSLTKGGVLAQEQIRGLRSVAEIFKETIAFTTYYRANHNGSLGAIYGFAYGEPHVEGCSTQSCIKHPYTQPASTAPGSGTYWPRTGKAITPWGQSGDSNPAFEYRGNDENGNPIPDRSFGKAGYSSAWDENHFIITHAKGQCYAGASGQALTRSWLGDDDVCRRRIMLVKARNGAVKGAPVTTNPFDEAQMTPLADDRDYQIFDGHAVKPYQEIYGQDAPLRPEPLLGESCYLQVVDARKSELYARSGGHPQGGSTKRCSWQGCAVKPNTEDPMWLHDNMAYLSVTIPELFDFAYSGSNDKYKMTMNTVGFMDIKGYQAMPLEDDGSVRMEVPCETPLLISGLNADGAVIAHDDMMHSLRKGEERTCHGCHDGHSEERWAELGRVPAIERFMNTMAASKTPEAGVIHDLPKFADVQPIITESCSACHTGFENDPLLYSRIVWDASQKDFADWLSVVPVMPGVNRNTLWRPLTSRFVSKFALESPLYWYAANQRTDGRTNETFDWDIDYKAHPDSGITAEQLETLRVWLDNGAAY